MKPIKHIVDEVCREKQGTLNCRLNLPLHKTNFFYLNIYNHGYD